MKRSEMVLKIACYLNGACGMSNDCCDEHAEGILKEIEDLGMQPPDQIEPIIFNGMPAERIGYGWELEE